MTLVAGFDVHRTQITFDALNRETGELDRGRIHATPAAVRKWVGRFPGEEIHVAVEACTGWLFRLRGAPRGGRHPAPRRAGRRRAPGAARSVRGERRTQLLELLQAEPGLRPSEAAQRMAVNPAQVHSIARRREEDGASSGETARSIRAVPRSPSGSRLIRTAGLAQCVGLGIGKCESHRSPKPAPAEAPPDTAQAPGPLEGRRRAADLSSAGAVA